MGKTDTSIISALAGGQDVTFGLQAILPNIAHSLNGTGFIFGAGASFEAGYPMMGKLTQDIMSALTTEDKDILGKVLASSKTSYDFTSGTPNIEILADLIIAHHIDSGETKFKDLEEKIRRLILEVILSVQSPKLENHINFFEKLKNRCFGQPSTVWIFTTNYDLLFEQAATIAGVQLDNGFVGTTDRYFNVDSFFKIQGTTSAGRFNRDPHLIVKLVKLHGSISWFKDKERIYERHPAALDINVERCMIMPRRRKVMDTLMFPYDALFGISSRVIGNQCQYLASCGFSFSDDHINHHIFMPSVKAKKCNLSVLSAIEPNAIPDIISLPNFNGGYEGNLRVKGQLIEGTTDLWKFSSFVNMF